MPFLELGKNYKSRTIRDTNGYFVKRNSITPNDIALFADKYNHAPDSVAADTEEAIMMIPTAINPTEEIKYGLIFIVVVGITLILFLCFFYHGYRQYQGMLYNTKREIIDLEKTVRGKTITILAKMNSGIANTKSNMPILPFKENRNSNTTKWINSLKPLNSYRAEDPKIEIPPKPHKVNGFPSDIKVANKCTTIKPIDYYQNSNKTKSEDGNNGIEPVDADIKPKIEIQSSSVSLKNDVSSLNVNALINVKTNESKQSQKEKNNRHFRKRNKIVYTKRELVNLEPIEVYQLLKYCYDDGNLLVTDLFFPSTKAKFAGTAEHNSADLKGMQMCLLDRNSPPAIKTLELFRFICLSFGLKHYENPLIFTRSYGLLVDTIINFNLVPNISNSVPLILQSAFVETIIMYCISCWKFDKISNDKIEHYFVESHQKLYIPSKLKIYEYIIKLLSQRFRNNLLEGVLIFFSVAPSPHMLPSLLDQIKIEKTPDLNRLFKYLLKQLRQEHYTCCANPDKWSHCELTTSSVEPSSKDYESTADNDNQCAINCKPAMQDTSKDKENILSMKECKWTTELSYENSNKLDKSDIAENEHINTPSEYNNDVNNKLRFFYKPNFNFVSTSLLPGSLVLGPIQANPRHA